MVKKMDGSKKKSLLIGKVIIITLASMMALTGCRLFEMVKVNEPTYTVDEGTYTTPITVAINKPEGDDISVYYTLDGTDPSEDSMKYEANIVLFTDTTLKSIAVNKYGVKSKIKTAVYTITAPINDLPTIKIPDLPKDGNDYEQFMNKIYGTWVGQADGGTFRYSFTPIDSTTGMLNYVQISPDGTGDGYSAYFTITPIDGSDKGTVTMTTVIEGGLKPINTVLNIEVDPLNAHQLLIDGHPYTYE